jgi:cytochrome c556
MRRATVLASGAIFVALGIASATFAQQAAQDARAPILVSEPKKAFILKQMRLFVAAIQQISDGLATNDKAKVAEAALSRGTNAIRAMPDKPAGLEEPMPSGFRTFGRATHQGFDAIAAAAEGNKSTEEILALLAATMKNCVACHQTFRLVEGEAAAH